jgi:hypothetical protein
MAEQMDVAYSRALCGRMLQLMAPSAGGMVEATRSARRWLPDCQSW